MSEPTPKQAPEQPRPPRRRVWLSVILYLLIFSSGAVCGAGITVVMVHRHIQRVVKQPDLAIQGFARLLDRRLDLTPAQRTEIHAILHKRQKALREYHHQVQPLIVAELRSLFSEIEDVLDDDQQKTWRQMASRMRRWLPPSPHEHQPADPPKNHGT